MSRPGAIEVQGVVVEVLRDKLYRVELPNGHRVLGHLAKKDLSAAPLAAGRAVVLEMSPFDFSKGRILLKAVLI
jgi:translation initiation factor IF-1